MELNVSLSLTPLNSVWQHKKNRREKYFYRRYIKVARVFLLIGKNKYKKKKLKQEEQDDNTNIHRHITHPHTHTSLNKLFGGYFFFFLFKKRKVARWYAYILVYERTNALMAINLMLAGVAERDDPPTIPGRGWRRSNQTRGLDDGK